MGASTSIGSSAGVGSDCSSSSITIGALDEPGSGGGAGARSVIRSLRGVVTEVRIRADSCFKSRWTKLGDGVWVVWGCEIILDTSGMISEVCAWVNTVRVGVRAGAAAVTVGVEVSADGIFGIPAIVADVGDAVAVARAVFVDGEGTVPGEASVVEPATEASLVALSLFSRATCKSNCKKSRPADCRLCGGFNSFWPADVGRRDAEVGVCIGV